MTEHKLGYVIGEIIGTFILVFIGCGSVAYSIINPEFSLINIALLWSAGVFLGIIVSQKWSDSHLNPAVSFAFYLKKNMTFKRFLMESLAQLIGAILAAVSLFFIFNKKLKTVENDMKWDRGELSGGSTAKMFGEFYDPNTVSVWEGMAVEGFGTFILVFMIFLFVRHLSESKYLSFCFIGLTVGLIIMFIAPITQCGINPARDLGPRIVSYLFGWKSAFDLPNGGAILVYVVGPFIGAGLAVAFHNLMIRWKQV